MTDYTWSVGNSGTMMIRDTGTYVEFWLKADSPTYNHELPWGYTVNGVTDNSNSFDFQITSSYQRFGRWNVTTDQTVTFRMYDSGTSGLGGAVTHTASIQRSSAPSAPGSWTIELIEDTQVRGDTDIYDNGGLAIDQFQVRYDDSSTAASPLYVIVSDTGYGYVTGLARGKTYYFWVRSHNAKGWSPWSARTQATTHNFPPAPNRPTLSGVTQTSVHTTFVGNGDGGSPVLEWSNGYGTSSTTAQKTLTGYNITIGSLTPGLTYYFWARGRNKYGWGPYSLSASVTLPAGAWVDVNGVKKRAVPYVRVSGVWKPVEPWAKIAGLWKKTG